MTHKKRKKTRKNENLNTMTSNIGSLNYENENDNLAITDISRDSFNRLSMIYILCKEKYRMTRYYHTLYLDLGDCTYNCQYCGVLFLFNEICNESIPLKYNLRYKNRKVKLPLLKKTPKVLDSLLNYYGGQENMYYRKNIRIFNSMMIFTTVGAKIQVQLILMVHIFLK